MQSAKQEIVNAMVSLPDTATYEDAMYRLYVLEKINAGEEAIKNGEVLTHDELLQEIKKW